MTIDRKPQGAFVDRDFERKAVCMLGLVFDRLTIDEVMQELDHASAASRRTILVTPNLNFLALSLRNPAFRNWTNDNQISVVDGVPLVWLSRLLGANLRERCAGSAILERLVKRQNSQPLSLFFFGGAPEVAKRACSVVRSNSQSTTCSGYLDPGQGTPTELTKQSYCDRINRANPDFLVLSLGAQKGTEWIQLNRSHLDVPIISHLGAAVAFVAGSESRAPSVLQFIGLEWLWRILRQPQLLKRYVLDFGIVSRALVTEVLPAKVLLLIMRRLSRNHVSCRPVVHIDEGKSIVIAIDGMVNDEFVSSLKSQLSDLTPLSKNIQIRLQDCVIESELFFGALVLLDTKLRCAGASLSVSTDSFQTRLAFRSHGIKHLLRSRKIIASI